ncbi:MAG: DEAD/DEAH box helicase family protein [Rickettsiales bacterium]|jgi:type III restriction enzyme|nr:DEAD/DEAH box helicase family protein [Rickettsiales bacterium]
MSLRTPQAEALSILDGVVDTFSFSKDPDNGAVLKARNEGCDAAHNPDSKNPDNGAILKAINALDIPKKLNITNFERDFPTICFSIATGVGKTRLMGAFITYLHLEKGVKNFFIIAPNLTIYSKLIVDFTPNTPKYVFQGIHEFSTKQPLVTTGDDYHSMGGLVDRMYENRVNVNIFNISKINRDTDTRGIPRFRRFSEYLGESYFNYLQSLPDLVLLMDEAHRYRAEAGMKIINQLRAVLGLELTATAKTTGENAKNFKNIVYHYPLAQAIIDCYVKKPTIVGRSNFEKNKYSDEQLEEIKLLDGFGIHEDIKKELEVYAHEKCKRLVKPFMLIIARDTAHANKLKSRISSAEFRDGIYRDKVIVVHSKQKGSELDENIALLLEVEKAENPIEVVIHVNMLAEGWDVNNLYTIVPLKPARTDILVEQSIGRGLRLPYGEYSGVDHIDQLNIVAHDKFNDIVETARKEGFEFQQRLLDSEADLGRKVVVEAHTLLRTAIENAAIIPTISTTMAMQDKPKITFRNQIQRDAALAFNDRLEDIGRTVNSVDELRSEKIQEHIINEIVRDARARGDLFTEELANVLGETAKQITECFIESAIKIPQISIYSTYSQKGVKYRRFTLDLGPFNRLQQSEDGIIRQEIGTISNRIERSEEAQPIEHEGTAEDMIITEMLNSIEIPYDRELLLFFVEQVIGHIRKYAAGEEEVRNIVFPNSVQIAKAIIEQMLQNIIEPEEVMVARVSGDYTPLRPVKLLKNLDDDEISFRNEPKHLSNIRNIIFSGFEKCLYTKTKFDSNTERKLSVILEDEPKILRWERLTVEQAKEKVSMKYYGKDHGPHDYCPDFLVETTDNKYIVETKAAGNVTADGDESAKREVAKRWCMEASKYERSIGGKPWTYILIPHDQLVADCSWDGLVARWSI